ncbi:glycerophosphodiester phosphodiesterase [Desulfopila aestuarii]|uniref:Glycerophosphoryl diester phosphodiesterase n=1 Tax=Desulfopila aestuarii DSM 18488 TaxID=1121416 RepID=A0A1M7XYR6_9BACT|nr:glycerophosphodiester phosphodiesterase family protein [Desulfopila aestuarii]SHO44219.1 glycerophosphoryl diester phosphodiesterase [Desulfopila aestuarii DSM 18488]
MSYSESILSIIMSNCKYIYNIAHRGARSLAPENTMPAFVKAWQTGAHGVETDVSVTSDGQLILFHDDTFIRTTDIRKIFPKRKEDPLHTFTWQEIQKLDAGSWFIEVDPFATIKSGEVTFEEQQAMVNISVPSLEELLLFVKQKSLFINIEIKNLPEAIATFPIVEKVLSLLDSVQLASDMFSISSFNHLYLKKIEKLRPDIEVNALIGGYPFLINNWGNYEFAVYNADANVIDSEQIEKALQHGCRVNLYIVNDTQSMARFLREGVDKIITDYPQLLAQLGYGAHWSQK